MKRLKLAWVVPGFQASEYDRCIPALTDLAHQVAERHDLTVVALQYPGREDCYKVGALKIYSFKPGPPAAVPKLRQVGPLWRARRALQAEHRSQPFDVVHAFWAAEPAWLALQTRTSMEGRPPIVVSVMGGEAVALPKIGYGAYRHRLDQFYLNYAVRQADYLTAGSQTLADLLKSRYPSRKIGLLSMINSSLRKRIGKPNPYSDNEAHPVGRGRVSLPNSVHDNGTSVGGGCALDNHPPQNNFVGGGCALDNRLRVLPLGVNTEIFSPAQPRPPSKIIKILAVGSLLPVKGHANLICAFALARLQLPDLELQLKIVGEGICRPELEKLVAALGLSKNITLAGTILPERMPDKYRAADLFVLSSYYESQCVALCEALACGLPVLAAPVGLAPELLDTVKIGQLANSNQPEDLAAALLQILDRRANWPEMSNAARRLAEERLSLQACTSGFLEMYNQLKLSSKLGVDKPVKLALE